MSKGRISMRRGLTLTELMVTTIIGLIVILAVGIALAGNIQGWQTTYGRVYSSVNTDSYAAKRAFDAVIRKSCRQRVLPSLFPPEGSSWVEVSYYYDPTLPYPDRYVRFYLEGRELKLNHGVIIDASGNKTESGNAIVCSNVDRDVSGFKVDGRSIQMILTLNDDKLGQTATVVTSAVLHNP